MSCEVVIPDFACDETAPYDMDFTWKGDDANRKPEGKEAVGASSKLVCLEYPSLISTADYPFCEQPFI